MTKFLIKPYSFVDFVNDGWENWKDRKLIESFRRIRHLVEMAAFAGNQTKIPILWDEDDYKFLSQFPPALWQKALVWRYNEGLLEASKLRQDDPDHSNESIPDYRDQLVFKHARKNYVFSNVYTGFRKLFDRLEKPIKNHKGHEVEGTEPGSSGLMDIDPFEQDPTHPRHHSNYKHGLMDYDLSDPILQTDDMIDAIPDHVAAKKLPPGVEPTPAAIEELKERMKKNKQHSMAGMSVLQPGPAASRLLNTWIYAQGLGLLGQPQEVKDPFTGERVDTTMAPPSSVNGNWADSAGKEDQYGHPVQLRVPIIKRKLNMRVEDENGSTQAEIEHSKITSKLSDAKIKQQAIETRIQQRKAENKPPLKKDLGDLEKIANKIRGYEQNLQSLGSSNTAGVEVEMPILRPGVALPRITDLSQEQKKAIAARMSSNKAEDEDESESEGGIGSVYNLLRNWDLLTQPQRDHLVKNQRQLIHIASAELGNLSSQHGKNVDKWSQPGQFYVVGGHTPNKSVRKILALPAGKKEEIAEKYYKQLLWGHAQYPDSKISEGTLENIEYFIKWARNGAARNDAKLPKEVVDMLEQMSMDIAQVCAAMLVLNLNNPEVGVYDPELGLTGVSPDISQEKLDHGRYNYAFNFTRDISQAALAGLASRRARKKGISVKTVSYNAPGASKDGSMLDTLANKGAASDRGDVAGPVHSTRRTHLDPLTAGQDYQPPEGGTEQPIARLTWKIPEIKHEISKFFQTKRAFIAKGASNLTSVADKAIKDIESVQEDPETEGRGDIPESMQKTFDEKWTSCMTAIISGSEARLPIYVPPTVDSPDGEIVDSEMDIGLDTFAGWDGKKVVQFLHQQWGSDGAKKWSVPLLKAISKKDGRNYDSARAAEEVRKGGIEPETEQDQQDQQLQGKKNVPENLQADFDDYMQDFMKMIVRGQDASQPKYSKEEEDIVNDRNSKWSLNKFKMAGDKVDAWELVNWIKQVWDEEAAKQWSVKLLMAIANHNRKSVSEHEAVNQILAAGIIPDEATPEDIHNRQKQAHDTVALPQTPQVPQTPAIAATDVKSLLADPVKNWRTIVAKETELPQHKDAFMQALNTLRQRIQQKYIAREPRTQDENDAIRHLSHIADSL